ncbi:hypothetical protein XENOCAPTIV_020088 [Xenoophorus captivus]|uniref:Uncharacterized protein n=1 Tax=Xenoophorus captivus TaxID=1517983 RepID=A0ABV0RRE1_9TELE
MPIDRGGRGAGRRPSNRQEEALHLSSSDDVTQEVPAGPAETKKDGPPDAGAMSFHAATWASLSAASIDTLVPGPVLQLLYVERPF